MIDAGRFAKLTALDPAEIVTHAHARDVPISAGKTLALVTLDNGFGPARPNTLGPNSLLEFAHVLDVQRARAGNGEIHGLAVTGSQHVLAAGADLSKVGEIRERELGRLLGELGHETLGRLHDFGVPTFVFIDGIALGGGAEICLNADYRTVNSSTRAFGFPEVHLGLIPGWGSAWLLPEPHRHRERHRGHRRQPAEEQPLAQWPAAARTRHSRCDVRPCGLPRGLDPLGGRGHLRKDHRRAQAHARHRRSGRELGCRDRKRRAVRRAPHRPGRRLPVQGPRAAQGGQEHRPRAGLRGRERRARRAHRRRPVPGIPVRLRSREQTRQATGSAPRTGRSHVRSARSG